MSISVSQFWRIWNWQQFHGIFAKLQFLRISSVHRNLTWALGEQDMDFKKCTLKVSNLLNTDRTHFRFQRLEMCPQYYHPIQKRLNKVIETICFCIWPTFCRKPGKKSMVKFQFWSQIGYALDWDRSVIVLSFKAIPNKNTLISKIWKIAKYRQNMGTSLLIIEKKIYNKFKSIYLIFSRLVYFPSRISPVMS